MTVDEIIEEILVSEGPGDPLKNYRVHGDLGGRTNWGISESAHPEEWRDGKIPSRERAREIYRAHYAAPWMDVEDPVLQAMLVDMTVLHGMANTLTILRAVVAFPSTSLTQTGYVMHVNDLHKKAGSALINAVVGHRCGFMAKIAQAPSQRQFLRGWINRAVKFLV